MKCLNCNSDLIQQKGKRKKIFCDSTCRSNYWQKTKRLEKEGLPTEEIIKQIKTSNKKRPTEVKNLNKPTNEVDNLTNKPPNKNYSINTKSKMPKGMDKIAQLRWLRENQ